MSLNSYSKSYLEMEIIGQNLMSISNLLVLQMKRKQKKAQKLIHDEMLTMENKVQYPISCDFINMNELYQDDEHKDRSEIYLNNPEVNGAEEYIVMSHQKALLISQNQQASVTTSI
jgi:hypothetical protein